MEQVFRLQMMTRWVATFALSLLVSAPAFGKTRDEFIKRVREVQDKVEFAYGHTEAMNQNAMVVAIAAIDDAQVLARDVTMAEISDELSEEDKGRIYEELVFGERDNKGRGSLANLFWSSMVHFGGYDPKKYDGKTSVPESFGRMFLEYFNDARSLITFQKGKDGKRVMVFKGRANREKVTRNMSVRFFDILEYANKHEKNDTLYDYLAEQLQKTAIEGRDLRVERVAAENLAMAFYVSMIGAQLFYPMALPFVPSDFIGWFTDGAWGSSLVSSAWLMGAYTVALGTKFFSRTKKSYVMLSTLVKVLIDPADTIKGIKEGDKLYQEALDKAKAEQKAVKDDIRTGKGVFGSHRARMMQNGYDPEKPGMMTSVKESCELILKQLFR